jgi:hypothetical protein
MTLQCESLHIMCSSPWKLQILQSLLSSRDNDMTVLCIVFEMFTGIHCLEDLSLHGSFKNRLCTCDEPSVSITAGKLLISYLFLKDASATYRVPWCKPLIEWLYWTTIFNCIIYVVSSTLMICELWSMRKKTPIAYSKILIPRLSRGSEKNFE